MRFSVRDRENKIYREHLNNKMKTVEKMCEDMASLQGIDSAFVCASTKFYGYDYNVASIDGGVFIDSRCEDYRLPNADLDILTSFDLPNLEKFLTEVSYLKDIAEKRIADIKVTKDTLCVIVFKYRESGSKARYCNITMANCDLRTDSFGDYSIGYYEILERHKFPDTVKNAKLISNMIEELKVKYNTTLVYEWEDRME